MSRVSCEFTAQFNFRAADFCTVSTGHRNYLLECGPVERSSWKITFLSRDMFSHGLHIPGSGSVSLRQSKRGGVHRSRYTRVKANTLRIRPEVYLIQRRSCAILRYFRFHHSILICSCLLLAECHLLRHLAIHKKRFSQAGQYEIREINLLLLFRLCVLRSRHTLHCFAYYGFRAGHT